MKVEGKNGVEVEAKDSKWWKTFKWPFLIAIGVFTLCMTAFLISHLHEMNKMIAIVSVIYAIICFVFLAFQLFAFIYAHIHYDEDIESVKYKVLEAERD